jgi:outer membrane lipoprotein-sorting protein
MSRTLWIIGLALALMAVAPSGAAAMTGREVFEKVHAIREQVLDREVEATMVLFDRGGGRRQRTLVEYGKKDLPRGYKALVVFKSPPDLKDVGFLIHAQSYADRELWAYFPAYKRVRRIATSSQDDSFFGSDFSYDDFGGPEELDDFRFTVVREEAVAGRPCSVVEVTPKAHRKYSRYLAWVAKDLWIQVRLEYYRGDDLYRFGTFSGIRMVSGIPTPFKGVMENNLTHHRTELSIDSIRYHTTFTDELFSQRALERAGH